MPKAIVEILEEGGVVDSSTLEEAKKIAAQNGIAIEDYLVYSGVIDTETLWQQLSNHTNLPRPEEEWLHNPDPAIYAMFTSEQARKLRVVPLVKKSRYVSALAPYDIDSGAVEEAENIIGCFIKIYVAPNAVIEELLEKLYPVSIAEESSKEEGVEAQSSSETAPPEQQETPVAGKPEYRSPTSASAENMDYSALISKLAEGGVVIKDAEEREGYEVNSAAMVTSPERRQIEYAPTIPDAEAAAPPPAPKAVERAEEVSEENRESVGEVIPAQETPVASLENTEDSTPQSDLAAVSSEPSSQEGIGAEALGGRESEEKKAELFERAADLQAEAERQEPTERGEGYSDEESEPKSVDANKRPEQASQEDMADLLLQVIRSDEDAPAKGLEAEPISEAARPIASEEEIETYPKNVGEIGRSEESDYADEELSPIEDEERLSEALPEQYPVPDKVGVEQEAPQGSSSKKPISLMYSLRQLETISDRDALIENALQFFTSRLAMSVCFVVSRGEARGWAAAGVNLSKENIKSIKIDLSVPSIFNSPYRSGKDYFGQLKGGPVEEAFYQALNRSKPPNVLVMPILALKRVVLLFYADDGEKALSASGISEVMVYTNSLAASLEKLLTSRKDKAAVEQPRQEQAAQAMGAPAAEDYESDDLLHRLSSQETEAVKSRPPEDDAAMPDIEAEPEVSEEIVHEEQTLEITPDTIAMLIIEILRQPDAHTGSSYKTIVKNFRVALPTIMELFPGPLVIDPINQDIYDLPNVEEHGIILRMITDIGKPAILHLLPLLTSPDLTVRRYATFLFTKVYSPHVLPDIAQRLFDKDPKTRILASEVLKVHALKPEFSVVKKILLNTLEAEHPEKVRIAVINLGRFRVEEAVGQLIEVLGHSRRLISQAAEESLMEICKQEFGSNQRKWRNWYKIHRDVPRIEWLIEGLSHKNQDIRFSSHEELLRLTNRDFGYYYDAQRKEREAAAKKWREWYENQ